MHVERLSHVLNAIVDEYWTDPFRQSLRHRLAILVVCLSSLNKKEE